MINLKFDPEGIKRAALAILKGAAVKVIKFVASLGRGKTPWVYYETKEGKRRSTFLKKSDFSGYVWNENFSEVINLETGDIYKVNEKSCSCQDWYYRVRTGKKPQCKHQAMREEFIVKQHQYIEIDENQLPLGCFVKRFEDKNSVEYHLYAWVREFNGEEYSPGTKEIGRITQAKHSTYIQAWTTTALSGIDFENVNNAIDFLLRKSHINLKETQEVYEYAF